MHLCNWKSLCVFSFDCIFLYFKCYGPSIYFPSYMKIRLCSSCQWAWRSDSCVLATTTEALEEDVLVHLSIFKVEPLVVEKVNYLHYCNYVFGFVWLGLITNKSSCKKKKELHVKYGIIDEYRVIILKLTWSLFFTIWKGMLWIFVTM